MLTALHSSSLDLRTVRTLHSGKQSARGNDGAGSHSRVRTGARSPSRAAIWLAIGVLVAYLARIPAHALIHSIGRNYQAPMNAWIEKRIFPNAHTPCISEMMQVFEPHHYSVLDVENLRLHYAKTLEHWLYKFEEHEEEVEKMFNQTFVRAWRLYLAGSVAAFNTGQLQLFQVHFTRERNNNIAWTRDHIYQQASEEKQSNG